MFSTNFCLLRNSVKFYTGIISITLSLSLHLIIRFLIPLPIKYIPYTQVLAWRKFLEKTWWQNLQIQIYFLSHRVHHVGRRNIHELNLYKMVNWEELPRSWAEADLLHGIRRSRLRTAPFHRSLAGPAPAFISLTLCSFFLKGALQFQIPENLDFPLLVWYYEGR